MATISGYDSSSIGVLFSSLNSGSTKTSAMFGTSDLLGISYSDYATIQNGSYTKLMKAYYKKAASDDSSSSSVSAATSTSKDSSKTLANIESAADDLKKASEALRTNGDKSLFTKKQTTDKAIAGVWGRVLSEAPSTQALTILGRDEAMGIEIDNGRIAVASALPDIGKLRKAIWASNEDMAPAKKAKTITDELIKPGLYLATPFGGGQIRKAYQGATAATR